MLQFNVCVQEDDAQAPERQQVSTRAPHGGNRYLVSTKTNKVEWPWSGAIRRHIYIDFTVYMALLLMFCGITLLPYSRRSRDAYNLVQSIQATLVKEVLSFTPSNPVREC